MNPERQFAFVVNPRAGGGKTARKWPEIRKVLEQRLGPVEARFTEAPGAGIAVTRNLLEQGFHRIVAVGGDGTINEVVNGMVENNRLLHPDATLGILSLGTGGDFQRSLGLPKSMNDWLEMLAKGRRALIDLGKAEFAGHDGRRQHRYFVNLVSFGMGGEVAARADNFLSTLSGKAAFLWATLKSLLIYRGKPVRLLLDGAGERLSYVISNVAVGNGRYHGGGMHPCPTAVLDDGILEVTVIDQMSLLQVLKGLPALYSDNVYRHPKAHHLRGRRIYAEADEPTRLELDGEPLGRLPLEASILPRILPVFASASSRE